MPTWRVTRSSIPSSPAPIRAAPVAEHAAGAAGHEHADASRPAAQMPVALAPWPRCLRHAPGRRPHRLAMRDLPQGEVLWPDPVLKPDRHDKGWPRFSLTVTTGSSDQSHRIYVRCQGQIDSHDARGPTWEGVQVRPLKPAANGCSSRNVSRPQHASIDPETSTTSSPRAHRGAQDQTPRPAPLRRQGALEGAEHFEGDLLPADSFAVSVAITR